MITIVQKKDKMKKSKRKCGSEEIKTKRKSRRGKVKHGFSDFSMGKVVMKNNPIYETSPAHAVRCLSAKWTIWISILNTSETPDWRINDQ